MTKPIKLTEDDIVSYDTGVRVIVDGLGADNKKRSELIIKQILENQERAELHNPIYKEFYDNWHHILQENKKLKEILGDKK